MSTSTHDKYRQLQKRLLNAPEYLSLPQEVRPACVRFLTMVSALGTDRSPPALEIRVAHEAAVTEARELIAAGRLTADLDGDEQAGVTDTERPPAGEPAGGEVDEVQGPEAPDAPDDEGPAGNDAPEDPLAVFTALVARGAKFEEFPVHRAAAVLPLVTGAKRDSLTASVRRRGLTDPIVIHEGEIVDGRNRLRACLDAGVEPRFVIWTEDGSVVDWIIAKNLERRHLNEQQRAMIAAKLATVMAEEGRERRARNLRRTSANPDGANRSHRDGAAGQDGDQHPDSGAGASEEPQETPAIPDGTNRSHRAEGRATERAADMLDVSATSTKRAARVLKLGDETLVAAVTAGDVSLDAAVQVAEMPKEEQREAVKKGKVKEVAKRVRGEKAAKKPKSRPAKAKAPKAADPEPAEPLDEQANAPDVDEPAEDEDPLIVEVHEAVDEVAKEARQAGRLDEITPTLRKVASGFRLWAQRLHEGKPLK